MVIVDARGLSCPEPVVMTRKAMMDKQAKYAVQVEETGGEYTLTLTKA